MTSYMYGSHVLLTDDTRYAVKVSDRMDRSVRPYEGTFVRIRGTLVEGYPVDGGPPLISAREVTSIQKND